MSYDIKDFLKKFFSSRLFVLAAVFIVFFGIILARIFTLQVVNGKSYQENFSLKIQMKQPINAARGNIYDKKGKLLAYNELAYSISINDSTTYSSTKEKNKAVNAELAEILTVLKNNGETLNNDFKIDRKKDGTYSFNVSGSSLNRFRADVFGKNSADDLEYNKDTGIDEANATAEQIMEYLMGKDNFGISSKYDGDLAYRIVVVRYAMLGNRFARYKEVKIATDVSDKTVAKTRLWEQYVPMDVRTSNPYFVSQSCRMSQEVTRETPLRFISADSASATEEACPEFGYTYPFFSFGQMPISRKNARVSSTVNCFKISCTSPWSP